MNKLLLFLSLGLIAMGCSKSSTDPNKPKPGDLSGTYVDFKSTDTSYNNKLVADGIEAITVFTAYGDTTILYPGTSNSQTLYNNLGSYESVTADTLKFTSGNIAIETNADTDIPAIKLTYDLKAGTFNDGIIADGSSKVIERLVKINSTTIELITYDQDGNFIGNKMAIYYRKQ